MRKKKESELEIMKSDIIDWKGQVLMLDLLLKVTKCETRLVSASLELS